MPEPRARERILARLRAAPRDIPPRPETAALPAAAPAPEAAAALEAALTAMRAEVHRLPRGRWAEELRERLSGRGLSELIYRPGAPWAPEIEKAWAQAAEAAPRLLAWEGDIEGFRERLFSAAAGITAAAAAAADPGVLLLRPGPEEPRLLSLVPPAHVVLVPAERIHPTLEDALAAGSFAPPLPANLVLVSGPSKTADIELTLAFGVHGPRELLVFILE
ncbi:MAG: lactate utilization protein [Desulfobacterales bacterium]